MIALTPEYLRSLADDVLHTVENGYEFAPENVTAALRTAADQLEAVRAVLARAEAENAPHLYPADIEAAINADTAPQDHDFCQAETRGDGHLCRCDYVWKHDGVDHACAACGTHWQASND